MLAGLVIFDMIPKKQYENNANPPACLCTTFVMAVTHAKTFSDIKIVHVDLTETLKRNRPLVYSELSRDLYPLQTS